MMRNHKRKTGSSGFTLLELMVVIGIVAVLVTLAVPAYQDYSIRAKIAECINGAAVAKITVSEYRQTLGSWPPNLEEAGLDVSGISHYCSGFTNYQSSTGAFTIDVNESVIEATLPTIAPTLTPSQNATYAINWSCSRGDTDAADIKYLPATCRGT